MNPLAGDNRTGGKSSGRIAGLDTWRFVAALWVVFAHLGFLPIDDLYDGSNGAGKLLRGFMGNLFAGPPAVIVFFVISGFCIHYPFRQASRPPLGNYLLRRYLRIGLPAAVAYGIIQWFVPGNPALDIHATSNTVVWSLLAEAIYYTLYPVLFVLGHRFGWKWVVVAAAGAALLVIASNPGARYFISYGPWLTWVVGLPCWLMGCLLAQRTDVDSPRPVAVREIWGWRILMWFLASLASGLMFHSPVGYPWTLNGLAVVCFFWLDREIRYYRVRSAPAILEWAGKASYSIYLCHLIVPDLFRKLMVLNLGVRLNWGLGVIVSLLGCLLFYYLVEKPSHWLARQIRLRNAAARLPRPV